MPLLIILNFFVFLAVFFLSSTSLKKGLLAVLIGFFGIIFLIYNNPVPVFKYEELSYTALGFKAGIQSNKCRQGLSSPLCHALYNKPILSGTSLIQRFLSRYSEEYLLLFFKYPILVTLFYIGIIRLLCKVPETNRAKAFSFWLLLYGLTAIFNDTRTISSVFFLFVFLILDGTYFLFNFLKQVYANIKK